MTANVIGSQEEIIEQISGELAIDNVDNVRVVMQPYIDVVLKIFFKESIDSFFMFLPSAAALAALF